MGKLVSIFWVGSFFKTRLLRWGRRWGGARVEEEFLQRLEYPVDLDLLDAWISACNPMGICSVIKNEMAPQVFKAWAESLALRELDVVHRYFNTTRDFVKARMVFHEIIRRQISFSMVFEEHGVKRALGAYLLLSQIRLGRRWRRRERVALALLMRFCHPSRNSAFSSLVKGRVASIVGGGRESGRADEIDASDLVARLNKYELTPKQQVDVGSKIDIVYLRGERSQYLLESGGPRALTEFDEVFFSIKVRALYRAFQLAKKSWGLSTDNAYSYALLNGVQAAIFDLVYNGVKKVKIFGVNFNLDAGHLKGYRPADMAPVEFKLIFGAHPPHIQFLITKFFIYHNYVDAAGEAAELLDLNYRQFARRFDEQWGVGCD